MTVLYCCALNLFVAGGCASMELPPTNQSARTKKKTMTFDLRWRTQGTDITAEAVS